MSTDADTKLLHAARRLVDDTTAMLHPLTQGARADATLDEFEGAIRDVAKGLNEWLRAYDSGDGGEEEERLEETRQRELDRQQPQD